MHVVDAAVLETWKTLSDEEVVEEVLNGHTALFEVLMRRHNERLYRAARSIVRNEAEAEDVMQQAYVNAYAHLRQFNRQAQFSTWLTRIAINEALGRVRRNRRYETLEEEESVVEFVNQDVPRDPERETASTELHAFLQAAIDGLPDGARECFMLRDVEGMSTAEVGAALGISEDAVKTRLSRARAALRRELMGRMRATASDVFRFYKPRCDRVVARVMERLG